jgi:hypothetical protein
MHAMRLLIETIGGLWELMLLAIKTRFRFAGPYWRWRIETAFGDDPSRWPPRRQRLAATLAYARWVHRMKHGR